MRLLSSCLLICSILIIFISCSSEDDDLPRACVPVSMHLASGDYADSIQYIYLPSGKLEKLLYYSSRNVYEINQLEYNDKAQLSKLLRQFPTSPGSNKRFDFIYNNAGKIEKMLQVFSNGDEPWEYSFEYDSKGRLSIRKDGFYATRYEYDDADNVVKIYYKSLHRDEPETLGRVNHTFDNHPRFFANVPELIFINTLFFSYEPSKNNAISTTVYQPNSSDIYSVPWNYSLTPTYDGNGMVTRNSSSVDPLTRESLNEISFKKMSYSCR
jgi:hypothetical protein